MLSTLHSRTRGRRPVSTHPPRRGLGTLFASLHVMTMFASLMAKSLIKRGVRAYRGTLQRYTEAFFVKSGAPEAEEERAFRDRMRQAPVLILEMADEPDHRYSGPRLVELLKGRIESGFCTIVVSALGPDRLLGKYGGDFCKGSELLKLFADKKFVLPNKLSGGGR